MTDGPPLRVAFDLDGVLVDFASAFTAIAVRLFPGVRAADVAAPAAAAAAKRPGAPGPGGAAGRAGTAGTATGTDGTVTAPVGAAGGTAGIAGMSTGTAPSAAGAAVGANRASGAHRAAAAHRADGAHPPAASPNGGGRRRRLSAAQERRIWAEIKAVPDFWRTLDPIDPEVIPRLFELTLRHRWETLFITRRPARTTGETVQRQTQRWLVEHGFELPGVIVHEGYIRGRLAAAIGLDVLVDDDIRHCADVLDASPATPILIDPGEDPATAARARQLRIAACRHAGEALDLIVRTMTPPPGRVSSDPRLAAAAP